VPGYDNGAFVAFISEPVELEVLPPAFTLTPTTVPPIGFTAGRNPMDFTREVVLTNTGLGPLDVRELQFAIGDAMTLILPPGFAGMTYLQPGETLILTLVVSGDTAWQVGDHSAVLTVTHGPVEEGFTASGTVDIAITIAMPQFTLSLTDLGEIVLEHNTSNLGAASVTFILTNISDADMLMNAAAISYLFGMIDPNKFTLTWTPVYLLAPGGTMTFTLTPTAAAAAQLGRFDGTITLTHMLGATGLVTFVLVVIPVSDGGYPGDGDTGGWGTWPPINGPAVTGNQPPTVDPNESIDPNDPNAPLYIREPWRPQPQHEFDRRYRDLELVVIPEDNDRIHRVVRNINEYGVVHEQVQEVEQDIYTHRINDTTFVSIRFVGYVLGMDVLWNSATRTGSIVGDGLEMHVRVGDDFLWLNGRYVPIFDNHGNRVEAYRVNGRIFLPLEVLGHVLNMPVRRNVFTDTSYLYVVCAQDFAIYQYPEFDIHILRMEVGCEVLSTVVRYENDGYIQYEPNGVSVVSDAPAWMNVYGTPMVSVRWVGMALDMEVIWDRPTRSATIIDAAGHGATFVQGSAYMYANGRGERPMNGNGGEPVVAVIIDGRMFVPLHALGTALHLPVGWNAETEIAYLYQVCVNNGYFLYANNGGAQ